MRAALHVLFGATIALGGGIINECTVKAERGQNSRSTSRSTSSSTTRGRPTNSRGGRSNKSASRQQQQSQHEQQVVGDRQSTMGTTNYNNHRNQTFELSRSMVTGGYQNQQQQWPPSNGIGDGNHHHHGVQDLFPRITRAGRCRESANVVCAGAEQRKSPRQQRRG